MLADKTNQQAQAQCCTKSYSESKKMMMKNENWSVRVQVSTRKCNEKTQYTIDGQPLSACFQGIDPKELLKKIKLTGVKMEQELYDK